MIPLPGVLGLRHNPAHALRIHTLRFRDVTPPLGFVRREWPDSVPGIGVHSLVPGPRLVPHVLHEHRVTGLFRGHVCGLPQREFDPLALVPHADVAGGCGRGGVAVELVPVAVGTLRERGEPNRARCHFLRDRSQRDEYAGVPRAGGTGHGVYVLTHCGGHDWAGARDGAGVQQGVGPRDGVCAEPGRQPGRDRAVCDLFVVSPAARRLVWHHGTWGLVLLVPDRSGQFASEAEIMPLPNEEVTPPVTKIYFADPTALRV